MANPVMSALRLVGRVVATVVVVLWLAFERVLLPLVRPLISWLSGLALFQQLGTFIAGLPPYGVLVLLAIPFVLVEPLKALGLYWMATGLVVRGLALFVFAHLLSLFTLDRIYHTGRTQLMKIGWFARLMTWVVGLRDWALGWLRSTVAWKWTTSTASRITIWARRAFRSAR